MKIHWQTNNKAIVTNQPHSKNCWLAWGRASNYYHWLFDCFGDYFLLKSYVPEDTRLILCHRALVFPHVKSTLDYFGLKDYKELGADAIFGLIQHHNFVLRDNRKGGHVDPTICRTYNNLVKRESTRRLLVDRRRNRQWNRAVDNVEEVCKEFDLEVVYPEEMSFEEQMETFSAASLVIGVHGAGLTNITFCNPGTKVIEIRDPNFYNISYQDISNYLGLELITIPGTLRPVGAKGTHDHRINIPIKTLKDEPYLCS